MRLYGRIFFFFHKLITKRIVQSNSHSIFFLDVITLGCVCLEVKYDGWKTLERKWEGKLMVFRPLKTQLI